MTEVASTQSERLQSAVAKHRRFWERTEADSCLRSVSVYAPSVGVKLPQPDGGYVTEAALLEPDMVDPAALIDEVEQWDAERLDGTLTAQGQFMISVGQGDLMPGSRPFPKLPWIEAMLGCPVKMTEGQIWNEHYPGDPREVVERSIRFEGNPWFELYLECLRQLQSRLAQRFPVSANTLLRGTSDLAAAVMGVQEACLGWIEDPDFMARLMRVCTDAVLTVVEAGHTTLEPFVGGYLSNYRIWAPAPVVSTQADHSTLVSPQMYEEQMLPYDLEVIGACPLSIFHLHNNGLHIAPLLVEIPDLDVIEVAMDPYPTGERKRYEVEMLRMILERKPLILDVHLPSLEEAEWLLGQLPNRGLCWHPLYDPEIYDKLSPSEVGHETWILGGSD